MALFCLSGWLKAANRKFGGSRPNPRRGQHLPRPRFVPRLDALEDRTVPSTLTVTSAADDGTSGTLRSVIASASPGDTIQFSSNLNGQTITLTKAQGGELAIAKNLTITGPGASQLAISGNAVSRVFDITGGTVTIAGLTITDGLAGASAPGVASTGGGILNEAGASLTLSNDVLSDNEAIGDPSASPLGFPGLGEGGGIANFGTLTVMASQFTGNLAQGGDGSSGDTYAGFAVGGGIVNWAAASVTASHFTGNLALGGNNCGGTPSSVSGAGGGGGICNPAGTLDVTDSTFSHNQAIGGNDNLSSVIAGIGFGGGISSGGATLPVTLQVTGSTFDHNQAIGGNDNRVTRSPPSNVLGPDNAFGGGVDVISGLATIDGSMFERNKAIGGQGGPGQNGGLGAGGGIFVNTFPPGFVPVTSVTVSNCTVDDNSALGGQGGAGGNGGDGWGGGLANLLGATLSVTASTVTGNHANGGSGSGGGSDGQGIGGGVYFATGTTVCLDTDTVANIFGNHASTSNNDIFGVYTTC